MKDHWYFAGCNEEGHDPRFFQGPVDGAEEMHDNALPVEVGRFYTEVARDADMRLLTAFAHTAKQYFWMRGWHLWNFPTALCRLRPQGELASEGFTVLDILSAPRTERLLLDLARWLALQVVDDWPAPPTVHEYLQTGNANLRACALRAARTFMDKAEPKDINHGDGTGWRYFAPPSVSAAEATLYSASLPTASDRHGDAVALFDRTLFCLGIGADRITPYNHELVEKIDLTARELYAAALREQKADESRTIAQVG